MHRAVDPLLRLSAQRALLGAISPPIRLVKIAQTEREITFSAIAAVPLSEKEREALSVASAEIISDFPECTIKEILEISDQPLPREDVLANGWVYLRAE